MKSERDDVMETTPGGETPLQALIRAARDGWWNATSGRRPTPARRNAAARTGSRSHARQVPRVRRQAVKPCPGCRGELAAHVPEQGKRAGLARCSRCQTLVFFNHVTGHFQKQSVGWERRHAPKDHRVGVAPQPSAREKRAAA